MSQSKIKAKIPPRAYFVMLSDEQLKEQFSKKAEEYKNLLIRILDARRLRWEIKLGMVKPEDATLTPQQLWSMEQKLSRRALRTLDEVNDILSLLDERRRAQERKSRRKRKTEAQTLEETQK